MAEQTTPQGMKEHPNERAFLKFLERQDQTADYVRDSAKWIKEEYPGSAARLIPLMRKIYAQKIQGQNR